MLSTVSVSNSSGFLARSVNRLEQGWRACEKFESKGDKASIYRIPFFETACRAVAVHLPTCASLPECSLSSKNNWYFKNILPNVGAPQTDNASQPDTNDIGLDQDKTQADTNTNNADKTWSGRTSSFVGNYSTGFKDGWTRFRKMCSDGYDLNKGIPYHFGKISLNFTAFAIAFAAEFGLRLAATSVLVGYKLGLYSIKAAKTIIYAACWLIKQAFIRTIGGCLGMAGGCVNPGKTIKDSSCVGNVSRVDEFHENGSQHSQSGLKSSIHSGSPHSVSDEYNSKPESSQADESVYHSSASGLSVAPSGGDNNPLSVSLDLNKEGNVFLNLNSAEKPRRQQNEIQPASAGGKGPTNTTASAVLNIVPHNLLGGSRPTEHNQAQTA